MKKLLIFLALFFVTTHSFAQVETEPIKIVAATFEKDFNDGDYQAIFNSFSSAMQNALPNNKTIEFLTGLKNQAGKITSREFIKYKNSYASYKTRFEKEIFSVNISIDENSKINGLLITPFIEDNLPEIKRNTTKLQLPFKGEWTVVWGGDTKELNYHVESRAQKNAFDLVILNDKGISYKTDGKTNEDYYAFGQELFAPCDGEVVLVVDGIKDNEPATLNPIYVPGNTVIIKTANNEFLFFAHFKQNSIKVQQGQKVITGQLLGLCGNTGNSSEPHLHFHIQNVEDMNVATGVKCYFDKINVNGQVKLDYSPVKNDKVSNVATFGK